jgi:CheY-like chemotaxis protein
VSFRVVYAEDDEGVRASIADMLQLAGVTVITCDTGGEAVRLSDRLVPDALLLDLGMPRVDGYEAARRVRENPRIAAMRIVALTGRQISDAQQEATEAGIDIVLSKPVDIKSLLAALSSAK